MTHVFVSCDGWLATVSSHWEGFLPPVLDIDVFSFPPRNRRWQGWIMCKVITTPSSRNAGLMQLRLLQHTKEWWASPPQWHYLFTIRATTIAAALRKESAATFHQQQLQTCVGVGEFFRDHVLASFSFRSFPQRKMQSPEDCPSAFGLSSRTFSDLNVQVYKTAVHCKMMRLQFPFPQ